METGFSKAWDLPHPPVKVWRALTEPALIAQWLLKTDMSSEKGRPFTFRAEPSPFWDGIVQSEILELDPQKRLSYAWKTSAGLDTVVTWTLVPTEAGTRLEMEHQGFKPENNQAFGGAKVGWERNVGQAMAELLKTLN